MFKLLFSLFVEFQNVFYYNALQSKNYLVRQYKPKNIVISLSMYFG